jgi:hypothetical protein
MADTHAVIQPGHGIGGASPIGLAEVSFDVSRLAAVLWTALATVLGLGIAREIAMNYIGTGTVLKDLRHFALDAERSIPSWYESLAMVSAAGLLGIIAALSRRNDSRNRVQWSILTVIFLLMSLDEAVSFHEITVVPLRTAFKLDGVLYYSWVVIAAPVVLGLGVYFIPFLLRLPPRTAARFIVAGGVFVGGALGTEFLCGYYASTSGIDALPYKITAASQECLEVIGMTLFVVALLRHLAQSTPSFRVTMKDVA